MASASAPAPETLVETREFRAFHNGLRILLNLDEDELIKAGVIEHSVESWRFKDNPFLFFIRAPAEQAAAIWAAIQKRQPEDLRAASLEPGAAAAASEQAP